jgi:nucleoside-diphosphate-sugar epimerase
MVHTTLAQFLQKKLVATPQQTTYSWAFVEDVARGHIQAMKQGKPGERYILSGPRHSILDVLNLAEHISGVPAPKMRLTPRLMKFLAIAATPVSWLLRLPDAYTPESLRSLAGVTFIASYAKAARDLGYDPRPLEEGLQETLGEEMEQLGLRAKP